MTAAPFIPNEFSIQLLFWIIMQCLMPNAANRINDKYTVLDWYTYTLISWNVQATAKPFRTRFAGICILFLFSCYFVTQTKSRDPYYEFEFHKVYISFVWSKCGGSLVCRVSRSLEIQRKTHLYLLFRDVILVQRPFHTNCTLLNQIHLSHLKCIEPLISRCLHFFPFIFKWFFCRRCENTSRKHSGKVRWRSLSQKHY